jgi:hypothetical protein
LVAVAVAKTTTSTAAGDGLIPEIGRRGGGVHLVVERQFPAGKPGQPVVNELPPGRQAGARHEARGRDGPGVDHRVRSSVGAALDARERVESHPRREDLKSIYAYLRTLKPIKNAVRTAVPVTPTRK